MLATPASASTLIGVGDRADAPADVGRAFGARIYRVVIDPNVPLSNYDARIWRHRQAGQEPQIVVGGTGTSARKMGTRLIYTAVKAARRWPYAYSVGIINEPDLDGISVCGYAHAWVKAYRSLRAVGVKRVTYGEWSPWAGLSWHAATLLRCGKDSAFISRRKLWLAWHAYGEAVDWGREFLKQHCAIHSKAPRLVMTEAGAIVRRRTARLTPLQADREGLRYWHKVFHAVKRDHIREVVAWDIHAVGTGDWDSGLIAPNGRLRPAFHILSNKNH